MTTTSEEIFILTVHTDSYAGNFEREFSAYTTGQVGECCVGAMRVSSFESEESEEIVTWMEDCIHQEPDEYHTYRPCAIAKNKNDEFHSIEIYFQEQPLPEVIEVIKRRAYSFAEEIRDIEILGFELRKRLTTTVHTVQELEILV